jgi:hypothetical protein
MRAKEESMKSIRIPTLTPEQLAELEGLYRSTHSVRFRTRARWSCSPPNSA